VPITTHEWIRLDERGMVAHAELAQICRLSLAELDELVEYGALLPLAPDAASQRMFGAAAVPLLREAVELRQRYDLDLFTVSLLLGYLRRIHHLEQQLHELQAHLPHLPHGLHGQPPDLVHPPRDGPAPWREPHA